MNANASCRICDTGGHVCPGCGAPISHSRGACNVSPCVSADVEKKELRDAIAELERDYARGSYSGGGYQYIEADPTSLRTVLDSIRSHPWVTK